MDEGGPEVGAGMPPWFPLVSALNAGFWKRDGVAASMAPVRWVARQGEA